MRHLRIPPLVRRLLPQVVLLVCVAVTFIYCLILVTSDALINCDPASLRSSRGLTARCISDGVTSSATPTRPSRFNATDRYSHYSARLSVSRRARSGRGRGHGRVAKDALSEMKFQRRLRQRVPDCKMGVSSGQEWTLDVNAIVAEGGSGLTSLSPELLVHNQRLAESTPQLNNSCRQSNGVLRSALTDDKAAEMSLSEEEVVVSGKSGEEDGLLTTKLKLSSAHCRLSDGGPCHAAATEPFTIPSIVHQTWDEVNVPVQVASWLRSWSVHNPHFEVWFWTDAAVRRLLDLYFPQWLVELYDSYPLAINRADLRKYLVLYAVGGLMVDLDVECLRPLTSLFTRLRSSHSQAGCVVSQEPELHQKFLYESRTSPYITTAVLACQQHHAFLRFVLGLLPSYASNAERLYWNDNVLNSTGPMFLSDALRLYNKQRKHSGQDEVLVTPASWFMPTYDPVHRTRFQTLCRLRGSRRRRPADCDNVAQNLPGKDSYTTHHWLHSWAHSFTTGKLANVSTLTPVTRLLS